MNISVSKWFVLTCQFIGLIQWFFLLVIFFFIAWLQNGFQNWIVLIVIGAFFMIGFIGLVFGNYVGIEEDTIVITNILREKKFNRETYFEIHHFLLLYFIKIDNKYYGFILRTNLLFKKNQFSSDDEYLIFLKNLLIEPSGGR